MFDLPVIAPPAAPANMPSLIPNVEVFAQIPTPIAPANPVGAPSNLPAADVLFSVPGYEVGAPPGGADPVLPTATEVFSVPSYVEVRPGTAPADIGDAAGGAKVFDVPAWTETKPSSAAVDLPAATEAFSVPSWTESLPVGAPDGLPAATVVFDVPAWEEPLPTGAPARLADTVTPTEIFGIPQASGANKHVTGLVSVSPTSLWMVVEGVYNDVLVEMNGATGAIIQQVNMPSTKVDGLTFDGTDLIIADNGNGQDGNRFFRKYSTANPSSQVSAALMGGDCWNNNTFQNDAHCNNIGGITWDAANNLIIAVDESPNGVWNNNIFGFEANGEKDYSHRIETENDDYNGVDAVGVTSTGQVYIIDGETLNVVAGSGSSRDAGDDFTVSGVGNIKGLSIVSETYDGKTQDVIYFADQTIEKIYKASLFVSKSPSKNGVGLARVGTDWWVLVQGGSADQYDTLLRIDSITGTTPNVAEAYDSPSPKSTGSGLTYDGTNLWVSWYSNNNSKMQKVNTSTGATIGSAVDVPGDCDSNTSMCNDGPGGITFDAENDQFVAIKSGNNWNDGIVGYDNEGNENSKSSHFKDGGLEAIVHAGGTTFYTAKSQYIYKTTWDGSQEAEQAQQFGPIKEGNTTVNNIKGMWLETGGSGENTYQVLYYVSTSRDKVYKSTFPSALQPSTNVQGLAKVGSNWWLVVDGISGSETDYLLKLMPGELSVDEVYATPSSNATGLAYDGTRLWLTDNSDGNGRIYPMSTADGTVLATVNGVSSSNGFKVPGQCGDNDDQMCNGAGGVAWTGSSLAVVRSDENHNGFVTMDTTGGEITKGSMQYDCCSGPTGSDGIAFLGEGSYIIANAGKLYTGNSNGNELQFYGGETHDIDGVTQIKAVTSVTEVVESIEWTTVYYASQATDKVYKGSVPSGITVTKNVQGMAKVGANWWLLVDATPTDYLLMLGSDCDTNACLIDASYALGTSSATGLTYDGTSLYYTDNSGDWRAVVPVNTSTGALGTRIKIPGDCGWPANDASCDDQGDIIYTGQYFVTVREDDSWSSLTTFTGEVGSGELSKKNVNDNSMDGFNGANALAYRPSTGSTYAVNGNQLYNIDTGALTNSNSASVSSTTEITGRTMIKAIAVVNETIDNVAWDVLYYAEQLGSDDAVYRASFPSEVNPTTNVQGMAKVGDNWWLLVDGTPKDYVLKLTANYGIDKIYAAPSDSATGLTYDGTDLWVVSGTGWDEWTQVTKMNTTTGGLSGSQTVPGDCNSSFMCDGAGGVTWNQSESALVVVRDDANHRGFVKMDRDGSELSMDNLEAWNHALQVSLFDGLDDIAHYSSNRYYAAQGNEIYQVDYANGEARGSDKFEVAVDGSNLTGIKALSIESEMLDGSAWNYLYFASTITDKVYRASIPSGIDVTTDVRGITRQQINANDPSQGYDWWLAVDGTPTSYLLKLNGSFEVAVGYAAPTTGRVTGLASNSTHLFIAYQDSSGRSKIGKINPDDGSLVTSWNAPGDCNGWDDANQQMVNNILCDSVGGLVVDRTNDTGVYGQNNGGGHIISAAENTEWGGWSRTDTTGNLQGLSNIDKGTNELWDVNGFSALGHDSGPVFYGARQGTIYPMLKQNDLIPYAGYDVTGVSNIEAMHVGTMAVGVGGADWTTVWFASTATDKVYAASVPAATELTANPTAMAHDGTNLWMVLDGQPFDRLVKMDSSGNIANGNGLGWALQSSSIEGLTYAGGAFYAKSTGNSRMYKVNASTGVTEASWSGNGAEGSLTSVGNTTYGWDVRSNNYRTCDLSGNPSCGWGNWSGTPFWNGSSAAVYIPAMDSIMMASGGDVVGQKLSRLSSGDWAGSQSLNAAGTNLTNITGLAYSSTVMEGQPISLIWVADAGSDTIYQMAMPRQVGVTQTPTGMTYDGSHLWIVVDAAPTDRVLKMTLSGDLVESYETNSDEIWGITHSNEISGTTFYLTYGDKDPGKKRLQSLASCS